MLTQITLTGIAIISYIAWKLYKSNKISQEELKELTSKLKSLTVLHGQKIEQLAPISKDFPDGKFIFLGQPVDGVIFGDDKISVIEIKSGNSQLSGKQRKIKNQIKDNKVEFKELRY